ncbi:hypothetical protein PIB30_027868 [Stylosanthes scabra]|uniref:Uncharacterized protein n=1 Tax=Stylosanthes scabra TaxID=79078 RepID=A0ABU6W8T7_9FABA|nr:hypothetical protein [Stylosanthes scabra]
MAEMPFLLSSHSKVHAISRFYKSLMTMGRRKSTARKPAGTSRKVPPPPLAQLPLRKWFTSNEIWKGYVDTFSKLPVLKPRYLPESLIPRTSLRCSKR